MEGKARNSIKGGYEMETLYFTEICSEAEARQLSSDADLIEINKEVYQN
jgi:TrmH family RNA methyltransferase